MLRACDNPFAVHRVLAERYRLDESGWARLLNRLETLGHRGAIVGPHGSGKTTLLEDLAERLERRGERGIMLVDGADQLSQFEWMRLRLRARSARGLIITSHRDGMLPLLHRCETSPELLSDLVRALGQPISAARAAELHASHRGNVRDAIWELYDRVSG
jgi:energy-coupling factor transporter ATP-binding protein EcfA2